MHDITLAVNKSKMEASSSQASCYAATLFVSREREASETNERTRLFFAPRSETKKQQNTRTADGTDGTESENGFVKVRFVMVRFRFVGANHSQTQAQHA